MDPANRDLLERWIVGVEQRRERHCGVFIGNDGQSFSHRARPWDYPDILLSGHVDGDALHLDLTDGNVRIDDVRSVVAGDHSWGPGLLVQGTVGGIATDAWLV